jgi:AraC-like DNA-binding protein
MSKVEFLLIKIDRKEKMSDFCRVYCAGSVKAPYDWITSVPVGINRLVYIHGGDGGYIKGNVKVPLKKGFMYFFPGNAYFVKTYSSYETDDGRLDHGYVNFELIPPILSDEVMCIDPEENDEIRHAVEIFKKFCIKCTEIELFENLDSTDRKFFKSTVLFLVDKIVEKYNCEVIKDKTVIKALRLMQETLGQKQTIDDIARECYLSTDGFIRKFKREVGETPYSYLKKLKIRTAQNMRMSGMKFSEIAEKCGYSDPCALLHAIEKEKNKM